MTSLELLSPSVCGEYYSDIDLNLFNSPECQELATQAAKGRHLTFLKDTVTEKAVKVRLCEDGYVAWLLLSQIKQLKPAKTAYKSEILYRDQIELQLPKIIAFTKAAMEQSNYYLWGGTIGPNYDCSGLIQKAFATSGIWLPRDSYQQESFTKKIEQTQLLPGDLIFFGEQKVNHVALYLGEGYYIHSSGPKNGRNGIAIDPFSDQGDEISSRYYHKFWSCGRVVKSYSATGN
ncbi:MAG TPA: glycoside hydrolase [Cyanothece sp. UBA12306]|nr:glycoside hydrolase [Cyanothece sp. UBA12306]